MKVNPAFRYEGRGGKERRPWGKSHLQIDEEVLECVLEYVHCSLTLFL